MSAHGEALLHDSAENRSTAFTQRERDARGLTGLLPPAVESLETQVDRCVLQLAKKPNDLERYIYLSQLCDENQTLFYKLISSDPLRLIPILYAPTVGAACLEFGHIYRKPRGIYVSIEQRGSIREVLSHWPVKDVRFICVTTGERILGLGDLGANGMGVPIGKLQLYTACASVPPSVLLPVLLDCGTNNEKLLADPLYLGVKRRRPLAEELDSLVEEFVLAVQDLHPRCCIHFEDWKSADAVRLLAKYADRVACYDDDIQGTGGVVLAGVYTALKITQGRLEDQCFLFFGAGSAAIGSADMIVAALRLQGLSAEEARARIWMFDVDGLLEPSRKGLTPEQSPYAHPHGPTASLLDAVKTIKPSVLVGLSSAPKSFTQEVVEAMTEQHPRPVIFALSLPTSKLECTAEDTYRWSGGKALYAAGVQLDPVKLGGETLLPGQANNFLIFPAVGLAVYATEAKRVPQELYIEAAKALADQVTPEQRGQGMLYPPQADMRAVAIQTAIAVAKKVFELNLARVEEPGNIPVWIHSHLYKPEYALEPQGSDDAL